MQALHVWGKLLWRGHAETCSAAALQELVTCLAPKHGQGLMAFQEVSLLPETRSQTTNLHARPDSAMFLEVSC